MPQYIEVYSVEFFKQKHPNISLDKEIKGFLGISYPGRFVAIAETRDEALQLCKMRLRHARTKHEKDWEHYSSNREEMIEKLFAQKGITREHVWEEMDLEKTE